ncbi:M14 family metallopeptidase [Maribacter polysaccharolyticus]|uniref:M14 family metallopeptidase n=1 Tax=Maribacter polysaccharolyticus TaxID=3020831 RepID=UPI00237F582A|nr:M14 metallopeptidase family protein [Maribacter polysaccharolyticus]MDE3742189.1 M14 family metallopeptidase [Maribacter polysaccharolyticus]
MKTLFSKFSLPPVRSKTGYKPLLVRHPILLLMILVAMMHRINAQNVPNPDEVIGFEIGSDFHLATYEESITYFKELAKASDMVQMRSAGKTSEGRPWEYVLISTPENLKQIDRYKAISQQLAHPEGLTRDMAKHLAEEGKAIVDISGGLHASEVAGAQHIITLAYELVSKAKTKKYKDIFDNVILVLWPSLNPDGQDIIANWYLGNVGTPYETAPTPWLYQKYVGHDNNRDAYMLNQLESRVVGRTWREWEPNIIHVHHQSSPFPTRIWLPPFAEPVAPQTPPLVAREVNMIGMAMAQELETNGQPGAVHMGKGFDAWYPGYIDYMPAMQNIPSFWTETALYRYATPYFYTIRDFPKDRVDLRVESLYSSPWKGGWWRLKDAVEYMQTASIAVLDYAAKYKETLLLNKYQSGISTIEKYKSEPPYAYFVRQKQRDPVRPVEFLKRLAFNGIKISQLKVDLSFEGNTYPKGTWVIPMDQEFGELARQLIDVQEYPDLRESPDGPLEQPYDAAGWTLPYQMEVEVIAAMSPLPDEVSSQLIPVKGTPITAESDEELEGNKVDFISGAGFDTNEVAAGVVPLPGTLKGSGGTMIVNPKENNIFRIIGEAMNKNYTVSYNSKNQTYAINNAPKFQINRWVKEYAVNAGLTSSRPKTKVDSRIGVYDPWTASMDMGWTRWLLDNFGIPYTVVRNADIHNGNLKERYDVILMASERPGTLENGFQKGYAPVQYTGGLKGQGVRNIEDFVSMGGTLVCMNKSTEFAIKELHLPIENTVENVKRNDFFTGGSIMEVTHNTLHPVMAGMPEKSGIFVFGSPVFKILEGFKGEVLSKYQEKGSPLLSGYLVGEAYMNNRAAAVDVHYKDGHVVLFGFQPQWRGQSMGTYRALFNALLYTNDVSGDHTISDKWSAMSETVDKLAEVKE